LLRADIAADLLIAIAQDPRHRESSRIEAIRLLSELGRPVEDFLHIISIQRIDPKIAIEAANQAEQSLTIKAVEQKIWGVDMRAIPIREARPPPAWPRLRLRSFFCSENKKTLEVYTVMAD
jgi:hypothetical protein